MVFKSSLPDVVPDACHKDLLSNFFWQRLDQFESKTLIVDYVSKREWTGKLLKESGARVALNLIDAGQLKPGDVCVTFYKNCDYIHVASLGFLFAGGCVCAGAPEDPEPEHAYMVMQMSPAFVLVEHNLVDEMLNIRTQAQQAATGGTTRQPFTIVIMDDDKLTSNEFEQLQEKCAKLNHGATTTTTNEHLNGREHNKVAPLQPPPPSVLGFHRHLLSNAENGATGPATASEQNNHFLPVQVDPEQAAFVLLTSGSTGKPKPVGRSHRNSLYMSHALEGQASKLWDLNESSVLAGHLQLDHGTGLFCLKMTISRGLKLIVVHGYEYSMMLDAIKVHSITDICLGSALVHNMCVSLLAEAEAAKSCDSKTGNGAAKSIDSMMSSLRNIIAVGSPIASRTLVNEFMLRFDNCSIRQAFGMTECGFVSIVERNLATQDTETVGQLLPNVTIKITNRQDSSCTQEITEFNCEGELYIKGPTVSRGYLGEQFREQSASAFLQDGFYKTNDICSITADCRLRIRGRFSEILCLHDGWKVLPSEIEQVILEHPLVKEAAVIGIPHPQLPTCHAPRAYIVPKDGIDADFDTGCCCSTKSSTNSNHQIAAAASAATVPLVELAKTTTTALALAANAAAAAESTGCPRVVLNGHAAATRPVGSGELRLTRESVFEFVAKRTSEPKHLVGGIKIMKELPRISIGKFDRKLLRKLDGY